ncbi:MAG: HAMP domain-containing sensor histidine kinase, partial [bacterium]|nr:HAMP domain-containing sensor histidine kinase [bacterium]
RNCYTLSMPSSAFSAEVFRLHRYYYAIVGSTLLTLAFFAFVTSRYAASFPWIVRPELHFWLIIAVAAGHILFFILQHLLKRKIFFILDRYSFIIFFFLVLYAEGGVESPLIFALIFPLLVSVVDLDVRTTQQVGIFITVALALFIFATPEYVGDPVYVIKHLLRVILFALIAFYLHKIVKETLRQKYEKEEAKRRFSELIELDRVKTDFITVVSHQLRTPLSALRWGMSNLIEDKTLSPDTRPIVAESQKSVERALHIVNELIETSETKARSFRLNKESLPIKELVSEILSELEFLRKEKGVEISTALVGDIRLNADRETLKAALTNVLDNAIRYSPKGKVTISGNEQNKQFILKVSDTGVGIAAEDLPYVSDRFYRGKNAILLEPNESGVGLYIVKQIVDKHGGTFALDSVAGKGTVVTLTLPL